MSRPPHGASSAAQPSLALDAGEERESAQGRAPYPRAALLAGASRLGALHDLKSALASACAQVDLPYGDQCAAYVVVIHRLDPGAAAPPLAADADHGQDSPPRTSKRGVTDEPLTSWRAVAQAVGVSVDTLLRARRKAGCDLAKPAFADASEALGYYRELRAGRPPKPSRRRRSSSAARGLTLADIESGR